MTLVYFEGLKLEIINKGLNSKALPTGDERVLL